MSKNKALQEGLGYFFSDSSLLDLALTHRSYATSNNERLEFLGDALLDLIISDILYRNFADAREGELTRARSALVKGDTLAEIAREVDLGDQINLGGGERKSGGYRRSSILADALEAIIGAVYLDGGMEACRALVDRLYGSRLGINALLDERKDAKTRLQEWLQGRQQRLPVYTVIEETGSSVEKLFTVKCDVGALCSPGTSQGPSKRQAEMAAAESVLAQLQKLRQP